MSVVQTPDQSLLIQENPRLARWAMGIAAVAIVYGAFSSSGVRDDEASIRRALAMLGGLAFFLAAARLESLTYRFDLQSRALHWRRAHLFRRREGTIPFEAIEGVALRETAERESPGNPRIAYQPMLRTRVGEFPLSLQSSHLRDDFAPLLDSVRAVLGAATTRNPPEPGVDAGGA